MSIMNQRKREIDEAFEAVINAEDPEKIFIALERLYDEAHHDGEEYSESRDWKMVE